MTLLTREPYAWVINLDAELELERGTPGSTHLVRARAHAMRDRFAAELPSTDVILDRDDEARARGLRGACYCPTPSALRRLDACGAIVPAAPAFEVLRRVNERGFSFALARLPGAARCTDLPSIVAVLDGSGRWILKRGFTFAGRGHRRIDGPLRAEADRAWIEASLRRGAVYVEPRVTIETEFAIHGYLADDGSLRRGEITVQTTSHGAWASSRRATVDDLSDDERRALHASFDRSAAALRDARYFGPFGMDAFRYRDGDGAQAFHALSEINARFSMGYQAGMGSLP